MCVCGGGSLLNQHQLAASTWTMQQLPQNNSTSALTTHQLQVERRESHRANQVDALIYFTVEEFYICHIHNYTQYKLTVKNVL